MPMPSDIKVVDLMLSVPGEDNSQWYEFMKPLLMDEESRTMFKMPAQYMFKDIPDTGKKEDYVAYTVEQMDKHNIQIAMLGIDDHNEVAKEALRRHPDRFICSYEANPNNGMEEVRKIVRLHEEYGIKAVTGFASGLCPQVPYNDKRWYPIYAKLVELDIPFCPCVGVPGPRLPMAPQKVELLDEICWFFPELKVVMRHGAEPWEKLAWKLMLKYPNLYYMTSAFAPKHYPQEIVNFANSRGADKVMYAGYFPMGLSLDRIFKDMPNVPFKDEVWPKFLSENARRVFKLD
ncbi:MULTISPECIES: amidohydrolase family protein [Spongiibacter]|jgi:predicted TIM-barrel fold metal-dependent hydrolase|uniref:amidohydrolase family protein n=1 Tax=Spongiibacter TaxID=630749 RepID=UPI0003B473D4|nr:MULTISPECIES: amidohydrolase family protein [Spongiibacter]MAY39349.1 amidohydrolase [Spongiibacter sp.]MBI58941.1 amidohydrolase [Spongiibacter sp.]MBO6753293.1 amidohydrolase family protein [Spongiibacter sp.]MBU72579.1 amidohydrolase [Spongiibacter sp.]